MGGLAPARNNHDREAGFPRTVRTGHGWSAQPQVPAPLHP